MKILNKLELYVNISVRILIGFGLLAMVVLVAMQISTRFILPLLGISSGLPWTEEAARYLMVWVIFLGGAIAARHGMLIAVTALFEVLPPRASFWLHKVSLLVLAAVFAAMTWYGWSWAQFGADETSPGLTISKFWLYLSMPVGCFLALINTLILLFSSDTGTGHGRDIAKEPQAA